MKIVVITIIGSNQISSEDSKFLYLKLILVPVHLCCQDLFTNIDYMLKMRTCSRTMVLNTPNVFLATQINFDIANIDIKFYTSCFYGAGH